VWQPLNRNVALPPSDDALRIDSAATVAEIPVPQPISRNEPPMNDKLNAAPTDEPEVETTEDVASDPIQEADALRGQIRDLLGRTNRLVHALKRQRRQNQLVRSTLASLKQLQDVA
jgi:TolA-binding protein